MISAAQGAKVRTSLANFGGIFRKLRQSKCGFKMQSLSEPPDGWGNAQKSEFYLSLPC